MDKPIRRVVFELENAGLITLEEFDNGDNNENSKWTNITFEAHGHGKISFSMTTMLHKKFDVAVDFFTGIGRDTLLSVRSKL